MKKSLIGRGMMAAAGLMFMAQLAYAANAHHDVSTDEETKEEAALAALNGGAGPKTVDDCEQFTSQKVYDECKGKVH